MLSTAGTGRQAANAVDGAGSHVTLHVVPPRSAPRATATRRTSDRPEEPPRPHVTPLPSSAETREGSYLTVRRAVALLTAFDTQHRTWSVGALAKASGFHKSMVTRLLAALAQDGIVVQDPVTRQYMIGPTLFTLGALWEPATVFGHVANPILDDLAERCGQSCGITVRVGAEGVSVAAAEPAGSFAVRVSVNVGHHRPVYLGASGKTLLAGLSDEQVHAILGSGPLEQRTKFTPRSVEELLVELAEIRRLGYALNRDEATIGSAGVAAPILDAGGRTIGSLFITFPSHLVDDAEMQRLARAAVDGASRVSQAVRGVRF
jgi:DNA-binding IclR family transcriptional regulator